MSNKMQSPVGVGSDLQRSYRMQDFASPGVVMRERSFIRPQSHINMHHHPFPNNGKRRSMILNNTKGKPSLEIYRPPDGAPATTAATTSSNKNTNLNVHAKEFTMAKPAEQTSEFIRVK